MFTVIYSFTVKPNCTESFEKAWRDMTILIRDCEGGLGSRLHKKSDTEYLAYAQWPDKTTWENAGDKLPIEANEIRQTMRSSCEEMDTLHEMDVVDDLLVNVSQ